MLKIAAALLVVIAVVACCLSGGAKAATVYVVEEVQNCDLPDYLAGLDTAGAEVVDVYPASSYHVEKAQFCPGKACSGVHCFSAPGSFTWSVYVVSRQP